MRLKGATETGSQIIPARPIVKIKYNPNGPSRITRIGHDGFKTVTSGKAKSSNAPQFKTGATLNGRKIVNVKQGSDDRIVLIGTKMGEADGVIATANKLKAAGKNVEILADDFLAGKTWEVDGKDWNVNSAWDDMVNNKKWDKYRHRSGPDAGRVKDQYLHKLPMYKINEQWIQAQNASGATIIDIGNPVNSNSLFYKMEQASVNWHGQ